MPKAYSDSESVAPARCLGGVLLLLARRVAHEVQVAGRAPARAAAALVAAARELAPVDAVVEEACDRIRLAQLARVVMAVVKEESVWEGERGRDSDGTAQVPSGAGRGFTDRRP